MMVIMEDFDTEVAFHLGGLMVLTWTYMEIFVRPILTSAVARVRFARNLGKMDCLGHRI